MNAERAPGERIATLDVIRGVAVMGILLLNIVSFGMPFAAYFNPRAYGGWHGADLAAASPRLKVLPLAPVKVGCERMVIASAMTHASFSFAESA